MKIFAVAVAVALALALAGCGDNNQDQNQNPNQNGSQQSQMAEPGNTTGGTMPNNSSLGPALGVQEPQPSGGRVQPRQVAPLRPEIEPQQQQLPQNATMTPPAPSSQPPASGGQHIN
ncbi:MAG TPA: hypothetical protein VFH57_02925 [Gammaproteobacteria bacterium]|nr:hypothetical protein [Gammaproteobacteria bacterium]